MAWNSGPIKFWDGIYEHPKECFDPNDEKRSQAEYLLKHPETQALASLFIAHMSRKPVKDREVLKNAGIFFSRPADVLEGEVDEFLRKMHKDPPREELRKKYNRYQTPFPEPVPDCLCPSINSTSVESVYSSFITQSTSATTILTGGVEDLLTPTLDQSIWHMILKSLNHALNTMYATRDHDIFYDEAYLCLMSCLQKAVETVWNPRIEEINGIIDSLIDDVRSITAETRRLKLLLTDKLPRKVNRLRTNFKGFKENEDYPSLNKKKISETLHARQGNFNRYPKDIFGVYIPISDKSMEESVTYVPPGCEKEEELEEESQDDRSQEVNVDDLSFDEHDFSDLKIICSA